MENFVVEIEFFSEIELKISLEQLTYSFFNENNVNNDTNKMYLI